MPPNFLFMDLPLELRAMCIENLIESWSLSISRSIVDSQIAFRLQDQPQGVELMMVSKDFCECIRMALVSKHDKKLEFPLGSQKFFLKIRQDYSLHWLTDKIESLTMHIRGASPSIDYHFKFKGHKMINLVSNIVNAPRFTQTPTVLNLTSNGTMDKRILNSAGVLATKLRTNTQAFEEYWKSGRWRLLQLGTAWLTTANS